MGQGDTVDNLIRSALRVEVGQQEPSPAVREELLAAANRENVMRSGIGPSIPPLAVGLCEDADIIEPPSEVYETLLMTALGRRQLLLLAAPLYAVR